MVLDYGLSTNLIKKWTQGVLKVEAKVGVVVIESTKTQVVVMENQYSYPAFSSIDTGICMARSFLNL